MLSLMIAFRTAGAQCQERNEPRHPALPPASDAPYAALHNPRSPAGLDKEYLAELRACGGCLRQNLCRRLRVRFGRIAAMTV